MNAAIYARYSSDLQSDHSIEDQVRLCRKKLSHEGWAEVELYADHAISGASAFRPGYQAMLHAGEHVELEVTGNIVSMINTALQSEHTKGAPSDDVAIPTDYESSVKVVAGVGFEPTTFRL